MTITAVRETEIREIEREPEPTLPELLDRMEELRGLSAEFQRVRRQVRKVFEQRLLVPGARYHVGNFVVEPKAISGGGFEVAAWDSVSYKLTRDEESG